MKVFTEVHVYDEDDKDFDGECWMELYQNDQFILDMECNNLTTEFMKGFLYALDTAEVDYIYDIKRVNEGDDYL